MPGRPIDGRAIARRVEERLKARLAAGPRGATPPHLHVVLVGDDPASAAYVKRKEEACQRVGIAATLHRLPATTPAAELARRLDDLNHDPRATGILLQLPLPKGLDPGPFLERIDPAKDVDCFHPVNVGRAVQGTGHLWPATPKGVLTLLDEEGVKLRGAHVVIVNHSNLIGRPLAALLLQRDATVTVCHKFTVDLAAYTKRADVLVTAAGVPGLITAAHVKPGAIVVDVGLARDGDKLRGDVDYEAVLAVASAVTPVPGGVGPMTVASLLENVVAASQAPRAGSAPR